MPRLLALVLVTAACGSQRAPTGGGSGAGPLASGCPTSYAATPVGKPCDHDGTSCGYAEGSCFCGGESYCGGVKPSDKLLDELAKPHWQCKAVRVDGCPDDPSGACSEEGKNCSYGDCCTVTVTCTNGAWVAGDKSCPP